MRTQTRKWTKPASLKATELPDGHRLVVLTKERFSIRVGEQRVEEQCELRLTALQPLPQPDRRSVPGHPARSPAQRRVRLAN